MTTNEGNTEEDFFDVLQNSVNTVIPPLLRAILKASGFNDQLTLSSVMSSFDVIVAFLDSSDGIEEVKNALGLKISEVWYIIVIYSVMAWNPQLFLFLIYLYR